jgi:hypothetical protein
VQLAWTVLQPSTRERRWLQAAVAVCVLLAALLMVAALVLDPRHPLQVGSATVLATVAASWGLWRLRRPAAVVAELRIGDGSVWLREAGTDGQAREEKARCVFAAPWLITFRFGSKFVRLWPDSLSPDAFRRVHACVRWERAGSNPLTGPPGANALDNEIDP